VPGWSSTASGAGVTGVASVKELEGAETLGPRRRRRDGSTLITKNATKAIRKTHDP
jgi:hypothetical protein